MIIKHLFDPDTYTLTYIVYDEASKHALIIDPVLDYDPASGQLTTSSLDTLRAEITALNLDVRMILETHAHADHLSASQYLKKHFPKAGVAIGKNITKVQATFKKIYNLGDDFAADGSQFDHLFEDGERVDTGALQFEVLFTPGHTPACASYLFADAVFVGDALFMPDYGTGRCDFPGGSASELYHSVHERLYRLPDKTRVFVGHDYQPNGRALAFCSTIGEEKRSNIQLPDSMSSDDFVARRQARDKTLKAPRLLLPSLQVNINAGRLPKPEANGCSYLKMPITIPR